MKKTKSTTQLIYIGLDVHKSSIAIAYALTAGGDPVFHGTCGGGELALSRALLKLIKKLGVGKADLRIAYEAGPTGFVTARRLLQLGYDVIVVAPSKIERASGDKVKTDKKDALKLARLLRSGDLTGIHIPDATDEAIRDVCRARTDASDDRRKAKQRLLGFMLRNGHTYTGKTNWTDAHMRYLREKRMPSAAHQIVLEEYLQAVDAAEQRVQRLKDQMERLLATWDRKVYVDALMAMRGFQLVAAMTTISELGDLSRFKHPRQLMGFLGLVPAEASTGSRRRQGSITKCGNSHARWMLVESAQQYALSPKISRALSYRQEGQSRAVRSLSWRAQNRLNKRFSRLAARRLHRNKITIAVARELCGFIWEMSGIVDQQIAGKAPVRNIEHADSKLETKPGRKIKKYELRS